MGQRKNAYKIMEVRMTKFRKPMLLQDVEHLTRLDRERVKEALAAHDSTENCFEQM